MSYSAGLGPANRITPEEALRRMHWKQLKDRFLTVSRGGTGSFTLPPVLLEIEPDFVAAARLEGAGRKLKRWRVLGVESRCFEPSPTQTNVSDDAEFRRVVREAAEFVGNGNSRYGLVIPDAAVRVAVLDFETLPDRHAEAEALVRWRMKELLPFPPEETRLSYQVAARGENRVEVLALAARNSVLAEYESALDPMNSGAVLILPATLALLPLLPEAETGQLLIHLCSGWVTSAVVAAGRLRLWRTRAVSRAGAEEAARDAGAEAARVLASCRDHLQVEAGSVLLAARPPGFSRLAEEVARALSSEVKPLEPNPELAALLPPEERAQYNLMGATIAGVVANAA